MAAERRGAPFLLLRDDAGRQRIVPLTGRAERRPAAVERPRAAVGRRGVARARRDRAHRRRLDGRRRRPLAQRVVRQRRARPRPPARCATATCSGSGRTRITFVAPRRRRAQHAAGTAEAAPALSPAQRRVLVALCRPFAVTRFATPPSNRELAAELVRQRGDREVPPARAVRAVRARGRAAAPEAGAARPARARGGVVRPHELRRGVGANPPTGHVAAAAVLGTVACMGLTGNWDARISRRTLLRTGGSATAAYCCWPRTRCRERLPPLARRPVLARRRVGRPDARAGWCSGRAWRRTRSLDGGGMRRDTARRALRGRRSTSASAASCAAGRSRRRRRRRTPCTPRSRACAPATTYWYRFKCRAARQPRRPHAHRACAVRAPAPMRFAFASCQNYTNGFFTRTRDIAQQDLDLVVHLGDYIYEGPGLGAARRPRPPPAGRDVLAQRLPAPPRAVQAPIRSSRRRTPRSRG